MGKSKAEVAEQPEEAEAKKQISSTESGKSGLVFNMFNIANCIIGSGIIALPYNSQKCGVALCLILLAVSAMLSVHTSVLLIRTAVKTNERSYPKVVLAVFGRRAHVLLSICNILFPTFIAIAYGIAIADNLSLSFLYLVPQVQILSQKAVVLGLTTAFIIIPLSLPRNLSFLDRVSAASIFFVLFFTSVFVAKSPSTAAVTVKLRESWRVASSGAPQTMGTIFFSYTVHQNIITLFHSLRNNTLRRFQISMVTATSFSTVIYIFCIVAGQVSFSGVLRSNMLNNYCIDDKVALVTRLIFACTLLLTYPFPIFSIKEVVIELVDRYKKVPNGLDYVITLIIVLFCTCVSILAKNIGPVIEIGGALTASALVLVFPSLVYMKTFHESMHIWDRKNVELWVLVLFGIILMVSGTVMSIMDIISVGETIVERYWCLQ